MIDIDIERLKSASKVLRAITHPLRLDLLIFISEHGPINVTTIYKKMDIEQSVASSHLSILRKDGFLSTSKEGKKIFYSVNTDRIDHVLRSIKDYFLN